MRTEVEQFLHQQIRFITKSNGKMSDDEMVKALVACTEHIRKVITISDIEEFWANCKLDYEIEEAKEKLNHLITLKQSRMPKVKPSKGDDGCGGGVRKRTIAC